MILYLHGYRSSPLSFKAQATADYMIERGLKGHFSCPQLPESPKAAVKLALELINGHKPDEVTLIGSSLGGFYANWIAEKNGCKAILLNPVVDPWKTKAAKNKVSDSLELAKWQEDLEKYGPELKELQVSQITRPERYFLIAATGDELLDFRQMHTHYHNARQIIIDGSDHSLPEFPQYLDEVLSFSGIKAD